MGIFSHEYAGNERKESDWKRWQQMKRKFSQWLERIAGPKKDPLCVSVCVCTHINERAFVSCIWEFFSESTF